MLVIRAMLWWWGQEVRWRSKGQESTEGQVDQEIVEGQRPEVKRRARSFKHLKEFEIIIGLKVRENSNL